MVRSSFSVLVCLGHLVPKARDWASGGETGPLAASRESLSPPESSPSRGVPSGAPLRTGWSPGPGARGSLLGGCLAGPSYPFTGGRLWARQSPVDSVKFGSPQLVSSVWTGQVLGRDRFSDGSGSRTGQVLGAPALVGVCSRLSCLAWTCRFGRLAGGDPQCGVFWGRVGQRGVPGPLTVRQVCLPTRLSLDHTELSLPVNKGQVWTIQR